MQKTLIVIGFIFILIGLLFPWIKQLGIGHLPGDFIFKRGSFTFYFPLATCIIASLLLSLLFWFLHK
jgi:hypothetical protein